ncbi:MAG: LexA family transcriptional regulator [Cytophagaceae bacterium]|nr:LexA family transcriptional regulator [Cytophagaceae bacterium]
MSINANIKHLRKQKGLTQEQLAEKIGIKRSLLGAYEEGRAEPGLDYLIKISKIFDVSVDNLISEDLTDPERQKAVMQKDIEGKKLRVLAITVDKDDNENIQLVPQKAAAGYLNGYADPEYVSELPQFYLPIFSNGSYRAFEISGDSMLPINPGSIVIGQYIDNWKNIKDDKTYILVTQREGIVYKRVFNNIKAKGVLTLVSDNPAYSVYEIPMEDVLEVWEAKAFISTQFPQSQMSIEKLTTMVLDLKEELGKVKKK